MEKQKWTCLYKPPYEDGQFRPATVKKLEKTIKAAKRTAIVNLIRQKEAENRKTNRAIKVQAVGKVMEPKLKIFEKDMIDRKIDYIVINFNYNFCK